MRVVKWLLILGLLMIIRPVFAITDLMINGQKEFTVTQVETNLTCTANLSEPGVRVIYNLYEDINRNGKLDGADHVEFNSSLQDGIGWIGLLQHPLESIIGDENGRDGTLQVTMPLAQDLVNKMPNGTLFLVIEDADSTKDMVTLHIDCSPTGTVLSGVVTGPEGEPIQGMLINMGCTREDGYYWSFGYTGVNGNYTVVLPVPGDWRLEVVDDNGGLYKTKIYENITMNEGDVKVQDVQLELTNSRLDGHILFEDGTPVAGATLTFITSSWMAITTTTNDSGYYQVGADAGNLTISIITPPSDDNSYFVAYDPHEEIELTENNTTTLDFTAKPYTAWISGNISFQNDGTVISNPGVAADDAVTVMVEWEDAESGQTFANQANSNALGTYTLGLTAGAITYFTAYCNLLSNTNLQYDNLSGDINDGDLISGADITVSRTSEDNLTFTGTVTDQVGNPVSDAYVAAFCHSVPLSGTNGFTMTDEDGDYTIPYLCTFYNPYDTDEAWNPYYLTGVYVEGMDSDPAVNRVDAKKEPGEVVMDYNLTPSIPSGVDDQSAVPGVFELHQNFPNPFNAGTYIYYDVPQSGPVKIIAYNTQGQEVERLVDSYRVKGRHATTWKAKHLASGQYFIRLTSGSHTAVIKCSLLK